MKILLLTFSILVIKVCADDCGGEKYKELGNGVIMRCRKGVWRVSKRSQPKGPPCSDDPSLAANGTCSADRGHCQQYTVAGADMDHDCPETCEGCDACRCQDASQWHLYCPFWSQYCGSSGVLGTWMTSNCRKTCGKCRCKCCSYEGKQHQLGARIPLPEKCGELICEEGLVADYSPLLKGAAEHKVSHPEELTLNFRSVHNGADCCILPGNARSADESSFPNGTMVQEGWSGDLVTRKGELPTTCCHGVLLVPLGDAKVRSVTTTTSTVTTTPGCGSDWTEFGSHCYKFFGEKLTWNDAQARCEKEGSNLASVHSAEENQFLVTLSPQDSRVMIGGNDKDTEGTWVWTDGSAWDYSHWLSGQPSNTGGEEHCLELGYQGETLWNDLPCTRYQWSFICKKK